MYPVRILRALGAIQKGYLGIGLNARVTSAESENHVAYTDKLDLPGVAFASNPRSRVKTQLRCSDLSSKG
jgi:hypothetical protein